MRRLLFLVLAPMGGLFVVSGCGGSNGHYTVSGKVLYKGEPAEGATVYFRRTDGGDPMLDHIPQGIVGADGGFTLSSPAGQGALPGDYAVLIEWKEGTGKLRGRGPGLDAPDRFKGRYMNVKKPEFTAEVKAEKNRLSPFELHD